MRSLLFYSILFYGCLAALYYTGIEKRKPSKEIVHHKTDKPSEFLRFHNGLRTREGASGPAYATGYKWKELKTARSSAADKRRSARTKTNGIIEFKERGPANVPGRTRAVFNVPGDATRRTWLAGSATGGIWRTTNGGSTWSERSADFPALPISSFASDAAGTVIYAGTGESVSSFYAAIGNGIFKSTDKGITWTQLPSTNDHPDFTIVTRVIVDPNNPNVILATTVPHNITLDETSAIMRSDDGGASWTKVKELTGYLEQVIATPNNFNIQYASQNGVGIWKSTDAGLTWNLSNTGMDPTGRIEVAVSPVDASVVFASAEGTLSGNGSDLYYSFDAGTTWHLVNISFNGQAVDFFEGQGFYDNTILCDPFNAKSFYVGGVSLFKTTLTSGSTQIDNYNITETSTESFLFLQSFSNIPFDNQRLNTGTATNNHTIEIRFGPSQSQKAHRFLVPESRTSGVQANEYTYQNYIDVPFEVWDVTDNKQLMVSFRDQNRNGTFDLVPQYLTSNGVDYLQNSREYLYIHELGYSLSPHSNIAKAGGQENNMMFNLFPSLAENSVWDQNTLPPSKVTIQYAGVLKYEASTVTVADGRGSFDNKNKSNQVNLDLGVHPDHHHMIAIIENQAAKTFRLLVGNDGGVFVSKVSTSPGITEGDWEFKGLGLNTGQFYGADKAPGKERYFGGLQDNGTRISPASAPATVATNYEYAVGGDGFEVIWNSADPRLMLATSYYGQIARSSNGGDLWQWTADGTNDDFPFVTRLANSKLYPDRVFTVGVKGVYVSEDFGTTWNLTPISNKFVLGSSFFLDVDVSRANPNIVWAGSGMNNAGTIRSLHVSTDGGRTFNATNNYTSVSLGSLTKLATHPTEPHTAFALFSFADAPKILRTTDLGQTWEDVSGFGTSPTSANGFPDVAVYCLYVRPDDPDVIWAGTEIGIVESLDAGATWQLLEDFPHVSVWEMKGQDDEIVIATHGRGIWTAKVDQSQNIGTVPEISAAGTSPAGMFAVRVGTQLPFDSADIFVNGQFKRRVKPLPGGVSDFYFAGEPPGSKAIRLLSFNNGVPHQSKIFSAKHHSLLPVKDTYTTYFTSTDDFAIEGMQVGFLSGSSNSIRKSLQTPHNYSAGAKYELFIRVPIKVSATLPRLYYKDIAIVEPVHDSVAVEATTNGLDWITVSTYDASFDNAWHTAFSSNSNGLGTMYVSHDIDFGQFFDPNQLVLFRFSLGSNQSVTGWGWSIEHIGIQEVPIATEPRPDDFISVYPNPAREFINIEYALRKPSPVTVDITDVFGRHVNRVHLGDQNAGVHHYTLNIGATPAGNYLLRILTNDRETIRKVIVGK